MNRKIFVILVWGIFAAASLIVPAPVAAACDEATVQCWGPPQDGTQRVLCGVIKVGACYSTWEAMCKPCEGDLCRYEQRCYQAFPNCCKGVDKCNLWWKKLNAYKVCPAGWRPPY